MSSLALEIIFHTLTPQTLASSHPMSSARIILDPNPHGEYYVAGDTVSGKVIFRTPKPKTLKQATIRCFSSVTIYILDLKQSHTVKNFDVTVKLLKEPLKLVEGDNILEFAVQIPMKRKVASTVSGLMGTKGGNMAFPEHTIEFKANFDSMFSEEVKALESLKICPIFTPGANPDTVPEPLIQAHDLSGACGCFCKKIDAQVKIEGVPSCTNYAGKMSFPFKISIQPPPGVRPLNLTLSFAVEMSIINFLVEKRLYFTVTKLFDSNQSPDEEGWFHQQLVAEFDASNYDLYSGSGEAWNKIFFWQVNSLYTNGRVGETYFLTFASAHASDERLSGEQKEFVAFIQNPENGSKEFKNK